MSKRLAALWIACACLSCTVACKDGFGRAVVDRTYPPPPGKDGGCDEVMPPRCDDESAGGPDAGIETIALAPVALETCGAFVPAICGDDALGSASAGVADAGAAAGDCGVTLQLAGGDALRDGVALDCAARRLAGAAAPDAGERVRMTRANWRHSNVAITSERPITLELESAAMNDVWIDLNGPVTLRIARESRLTDVRIRVRAAAAGAPRVELADSRAERLALASDGEDAFSGTITLARMHLQRTQLRAREVSLESVSASDLKVEAVDLTIADGALEGVVFAFEHAVMAATIARNVNVERCGTFTLANGTFEHASFAPCVDGPLRAYGVLINQSTIAGQVDGDHAYFERVRFGAHDELSVIGWDSTFRGVNFCGLTRSARFGHLPKVVCSACQDGAREVDPHACLAPATTLAASDNFCEVLNDELPECPAPKPVRERPH